ncbi:MAG: helix-turn-helix domain-containing protein [Saprospiraceae bacterium]|nr:helix-turn-helix domain-containing protein [Saprospiraceae bacterium]
MNNPFEVIEAKLENIETLLLELKHNKGNIFQKENDHWLDLKELCQFLPDKPSKATVYSWIHNRTIPFHKGTKKLRFLQSEIDAWMKEGRKTSSIGPVIPPENYLKPNKKLEK